MSAYTYCPNTGERYRQESLDGECPECGDGLDWVGHVGGSSYQHPMPAGPASHKAAREHASQIAVTASVALAFFAMPALAILLMEAAKGSSVAGIGAVAIVCLPFLIYTGSYFIARFGVMGWFR